MVYKIITGLLLSVIVVIQLVFLDEIHTLSTVILERQNLQDAEMITFKRDMQDWELRMNSQSMVINNYLHRLDEFED